jgi:LPXTG-site transpeptidase (sortase) family protein
MANKAARWIANVLLLAGVIAVSFSAGSFIAMTVWQKWQNHKFDHQRTVSQSSVQPQIRNGDIVGRLAIPRLKVRAMVREGTGERTLSLALGHIPGTALPGQKGNIGVAGHRDTLFRALRNVAANDEITLETPHDTLVYRVETTQIVKPEDVQVLDPGPARELTLVTCYPFEYVGSAPDRFIVKAKLISDTAGDNDIHQQPAHVLPVAAVRPKPEIAFDVSEGHSRELVPGKIWFGLSSADTANRTVDGWVWVMPERRTIWLRSAVAHRPVFFYENGDRHELMITGVARNSAQGYLVPSPGRG